MRLSRREFISVAGAAAAFTALDRRAGAWAAAVKKGPPVQLFNGKDLAGWYTFLRSKGAGADPEGIFKVEDQTIHVLGKEFGYLATNDEYDDFHLSLEFKWGEKKFPPRDKAKRDSGVLYRYPAGQPDKVWPQSIECQIQEGDCGDFWLIGGASIVAGGEPQTRYFKKKRDKEKAHGKWNRIEVIAEGGRCVHVVNGAVVNEGESASLGKGRILLQSEGAEVFFRKIELRPLVGRK